MRITKIEVQKKNSKRYSLYSDDVFLFGVSEDTLVHFHIRKGLDYSDDDLKEILQHEEVMQCLAQAYRYLSRRQHLTAELIRKLRLKDFENSVIEKVVSQLKQDKYLNDQNFIKDFIKDEIKFRKSGPLIIQKKLMGKGAARQDIENLLNNSYTEEAQIANAKYLHSKKSRSADKPDVKKLNTHLQQKGFTWEIIRKVLDSEDSI